MFSPSALYNTGSPSGPIWDASAYAKHRPIYPNHLFDAILEFSDITSCELAVDVGCGSGQVACSLANRFVRVVGLDTSESQLANAFSRPNIEYRLGVAESTGLSAGSADLVTAAAALHWFDLHEFYAEARRILRPGGTLAAWSYNQLPDFGHRAALEAYIALRRTFWQYFDPRLQAIMTNGYEGYEPQPSEFSVVERHSIRMEWETSIASLAGWVRSWSPFTAFVQKKGQAAADEVLSKFEADMIAALGVADRDTPVTALLPLDVILAKGPVPV